MNILFSNHKLAWWVGSKLDSIFNSSKRSQL